MNVSLDLLRTFVAVYRTGSVTGAARQLRLAQRTVTGHLGALEKALGRRLFEYRPQGVEPTPEADHLALRLAPPLDTIQDVLAGGAGAGLGGAVHLGGPAEITTTVILPALADLVGEGLRLHVTLGLPNDLLASLVSGQLDLVISTVRPRCRRVLVEVIGDEEFVLVGNPDWARRLRAPIPPAALPDTLGTVPLIDYAEDQPILRRYWKEVCGVRLGRPADLVVPDLRGVLSAVLAGAGVSVLPRYLCARELRCNALRPLCEPEPPPFNRTFLVRREDTAPYSALESVRGRILGQGRLW